MRVYQQLGQLRQLVEREIVVRHIATYDLYGPRPEEEATAVYREMAKLRIDTAPLKEGPKYHRYVQAKELKEAKGPCKECADPISVATVIAENLPIVEVFEALYENPFLFVLRGRRIEGIVTKADLQRIPVRILMFGLITLLEMNLREIVRNQYGEGDWVEALNKTRMDKARKLQEERNEQDTGIGLLECVQLCDLRDIVAKGPLLHEMFPGLSPIPFEKCLKEIEDYRNNLAHAQALDLSQLLNVFRQLQKTLDATDKWLSARLSIHC